MASYGHTFTSGDTVTPTKLNNARTVSNIVNADIKSDAAIAHSKLANIPSGQLLLGNGSNVPTATAVTGDVTISNTGVTAITAGSIVNADIKSDAAIAGTKISPDFGSQNVVTTGFVTAGAASRAVGGNTAQLQSHGTTGARFAATRWTADTNGPILTLAKSRGAAVGTRGVVQSGDTLTAMEFFGDDGTSDVMAARILAQVDGTPGTNDMPGRLVFGTTADGGNSSTERMRIDSAGRVILGGASNIGSQPLQVHSVSPADVVGVYRWFGDSAGPRINLVKSRGTSVGTNTVVQNGDSLGLIRFQGADGSDTASIGASIEVYVDGTPGTNDMPGRMIFSTTADGGSTPTARMLINSSGNVGIANTSPSEKLHVTGNIKASGYIDADTSFRGQASDSASAPSFTWTGDTNTGMFRPAADTLAFCEGGVEAMRISDNGSILIGTTTPVDPAQGSTDGATFWLGKDLRVSNTGPALRLRRRSTNGTTMSFNRDTTTVGTISVTTTATAYNTSSDYRLKENPTPLIGGLATIDQLQPCEFTWKSDGSIGRGFIAHELQAVVPEAVTGAKDAVDVDGKPEYQGVDAAKLVPYLVSAIKELKARVEALEAAQ